MRLEFQITEKERKRKK